MKYMLALMLSLLLAWSAAAQQSKVHFRYPPGKGYVPDSGFVPNAAVARGIAEAVWVPIYGKEVLEQKPFRAVLHPDSVWVVQGTLPKQYTVGGTAYIEIRKRDGCILKVTHGK